jgi:hypothetical protein
MTTELITKIRSGKYTERELINLHQNATTKNAIDVIAAIESQMRDQFPRAANRLFGKKASYAVERLQSVLDKLEAELNLGANKLKNGVKPGGQKIAGKKYLNVYASFRNKSGYGALISMEQETHESELLTEVWSYKIKPNPFKDIKVFTMDQFDEASNEYISLVKKLAEA